MGKNMLSKEILENRIQTLWAGREIVYYAETDSTNARASQMSEKMPHGTLFAAERQTLGRGRRGRGWESSDGKDIFLSLLLKPDFSPEKAPMLTIVAALAAAEAVREVSGADARIKWPNDLVIGERKYAES